MSSLTHPLYVSNISIIKKTLTSILLISFAIELIAFPSIENFVGGIVSLISMLMFFNYVCKINIIRKYPIGFLVLLQLFCFMYLPMPMTLLDGMEMSHHLHNPILTYCLQLFYFIVTIAAFKTAGRLSRRHHGLRNILCRYKYFSCPTPFQLWILAIIGWIPKLFLFTNQYGDEATAGAGTATMFSIFIYAPLLLLFMPLMNGGGKNCSHKMRTFVYMYAGALIVVLIASNSRSQMLSPIVLIIFCYIITLIYKRTNRIWLSMRKIVIAIIAVLFITGPASDMAFAMLLAREDRQNTSFTDLLDKTLLIYSDKDKLHKLMRLADSESRNYAFANSNDWNEFYVSNLFLNRFCNYRVVDATIYHALRAGIPNTSMQDDFIIRLQSLFPQPVAESLFGIDKTRYHYSSMDKLYAVSMRSAVFASYIVGGDVGLGLSVFGPLYFLIQFIVYTLMFLLFCNIVAWKGNTPVFPCLVLIGIYFDYFLKLQVAGGIIAHVTFIIWGFFYKTFFQQLTYLIVKRITPNR